MSRKSNLQHEFLQELKKETKFGEKKHEAKQMARAEAEKNKDKYKQVKGIYSYKTYKDYSKSLKSFTNYVVKNHTEVKTMEQARAYIPEYINDLRSRELSEWTIHMYAYSLRSAYHCEIEDLNIKLGTRSRADVTRCRDGEDNRYRESERYKETVDMIIATGCRRSEFLRLRSEDFREKTDKDGNKTGELEVYKRGKNGIERWCLVNPNYTDYVRSFLETKETIPIGSENRLFQKSDIPSKLPVHDLRADYARDLYRYYEANGYGNGEMYHCRGELKGIHFDKGILEKVSFDLQHSRDNVVVEYLYKM